MSLVAQLQSQPLLFIGVAIAFGLAIGSFLNVVIHRLPRMLDRQIQAECAEMRGEPPADPSRYNLVVPRSACPACGHQISARENIPVVSYLALRGRCSACKAPISPRYPVVEALSGLLAGYIAWRYGFGMKAIAAMVFVWCLIALTFIDLDTLYLPDAITLPLAWAGLLVNMTGVFTDLQSAVIGAMAGYLALWSVYWLFRLATGKIGMGYGDFKLLAAIGAWLGWSMLPAVILISSLVGAAVGLVLIVAAQHGRDVPIPFGPYLATAGLVALFWGENLNRYYLNLLL